MIQPGSLSNADLARAIYLIAGAISTALRGYDVKDGRLYPEHHTELSKYAFRNRSNLLATMKLLVAVIRESDDRRGVTNDRGHWRFLKARAVLGAGMMWIHLIPLGTKTGDPPLEI